MTATEHNKEADIRHALDLLTEARRIFRMHGDSATTQVIDLAHHLGAATAGVTDYPETDPIPFEVI